MSKPKVLNVFDTSVPDGGKAYPRINNNVTVKLSEDVLTVQESIYLYEGAMISFKAPCDCEVIKYIKINDKNYTIKSSNGKTISGWNGIFSNGSYVSLTIDPTKTVAYILNQSYVGSKGESIDSYVAVPGSSRDNKAYGVGSTVLGYQSNISGTLGFIIKKIYDLDVSGGKIDIYLGSDLDKANEMLSSLRASSTQTNASILHMYLKNDVYKFSYVNEKSSVQPKDSIGYWATLTVTIIPESFLRDTVVWYDPETGDKVNNYFDPSNPNIISVHKFPNIGYYKTDLVGTGALTSGTLCKATGSYSGSFGYNNISYGNYGFTVNYFNEAGLSAFASGTRTKALGPSSHTEGIETEAHYESDHAEGRGTIAKGKYSHAQNLLCIASGEMSHSGGKGSESEGDGAFSHGHHCKAIGPYSVALNMNTEASGSNSLSAGNGTKALGDNSVALIQGSTSHSYNAIAAGLNAEAFSPLCIALGYGSKAGDPGYKDTSNWANQKGTGAIAIGWGAEATSKFSQAIGLGVKTGKPNQVVLGKYNKVSTHADFIVGNGTGDTSRSNSFELNNGKAYAYDEQLSTVETGKFNLSLYFNLGEDKEIHTSFPPNWRFGDYTEFVVSSFALDISDQYILKGQEYKIKIPCSTAISSYPYPFITIVAGNINTPITTGVRAVWNSSGYYEVVLKGLDTYYSSTASDPLYLLIQDIANEKQISNLNSSVYLDSDRISFDISSIYTRHDNLVTISGSGEVYTYDGLDQISGLPFTPYPVGQYVDLIFDTNNFSKFPLEPYWTVEDLNVKNATRIFRIQGTYFI